MGEADFGFEVPAVTETEGMTQRYVRRPAAQAIMAVELAAAQQATIRIRPAAVIAERGGDVETVQCRPRDRARHYAVGLGPGGKCADLLTGVDIADERAERSLL